MTVPLPGLLALVGLLDNVLPPVPFPSLLVGRLGLLLLPSLRRCGERDLERDGAAGVARWDPGV